MRRLRVALFPALGLAAALAVASCAHEATTPSPSAQASLIGDVATLGNDVLSQAAGTLMVCSPQAPSTTIKRIGKAGGTLRMGPHELVIPAGALESDVTITGEVVRDNVNSVRLSPEGLRFAKGKPATLTLSYSNCLNKDLPSPKRIVYTTELLDLLEILKSVDLASADEVTAELEHFSRYAVAY